MPDTLDIERIAEFGWLARASPGFRSAVIGELRWQHLNAGVVASAGGDGSGELTVLVDGVLSVIAALGPADSPVMHYLHPVAWFGFGPLMRAAPRRFTIIARTPVKLGRISQARLQRGVLGSGDAGRYFADLVMAYVDELSQITTDLLIRNSTRRCAAVLLRLSGHGNPLAPAVVPITQEELANAANLSRNTAGLILRGLARQRWLEVSYGGIRLHRPDWLRRLADGDIPPDRIGL